MVRVEIIKNGNEILTEVLSKIVKKVAEEFGDKVEVFEFSINDEEGKKHYEFFNKPNLPMLIIDGMNKPIGVPDEVTVKAEIEQALKESKWINKWKIKYLQRL